MKNIVHVVIKNGVVLEAYGADDTELVVYDLDTDDPEMKEEVEKALSSVRAKTENHELEIF